MKRSTLFSLMIATSTTAVAQSSVTLYGIVDNAVQYETGLPGGNRLAASSGNWAASRLGFLGTEELGGGTQATFRLETRLNTQNGSYTNGTFFSGQATVGLRNPTYGAFRLGNMGQSEILQDISDIDPQYAQKYAVGTLVRGRVWPQTANGIEYTSPALAGLTVKGQYALTNATTWNAGTPGTSPSQLGGGQGRSDGIKLQYEIDRLTLQVIYDEVRDATGRFSNVYTASRSISAGGTLREGPLRFYAGYQHLRAPDASNAGYFGSAAPTTLPGGASLPTTVDHVWLGTTWQVNPATTLTSAVYHANANHGNGNATLFTLAGTYSLSKRTLLYSELGYLRNSRTSNLGLNSGAYGANIVDDPVSGNASSSNPRYGHSQFGAFAGLAVRF
ncbi:porin [Burkholderia cepacia]|nr:porin [Burkholderia cepacia]